MQQKWNRRYATLDNMKKCMYHNGMQNVGQSLMWHSVWMCLCACMWDQISLCKCHMSWKEGMKQRVNVKFCFQLVKTAKKTFQMLKSVYDDENMSCTHVFKWFYWFHEAWEEIYKKSGNPMTAGNTNVTEKFWWLVGCVRQLTMRITEIELDISTILEKDLRKGKICLKFILYNLTYEQKVHCV